MPNPRDLPAVFKDAEGEKFHSFPAVNTLFNAMAHHAEFDTVDWSGLVISVGGGMAVQSATAKLWLDKTGCPIVEGYGLSETSPSATCNPVDSTAYSGNIGLPMPNTELKLLDDDGNEVPLGTPGEIAIKGPQVMAGYWQRPDETAKVMTPDGFFRSGDIGVVDERGYFKIVDRKKDMILVSGFNVYPNEVEDVVTQMPGVLECAAVGVADAKAGEAVKLCIVKSDPNVTEAQVRAYCEANLTGYKRPKIVEFRTELPKTPVGKILRRELRDKADARQIAAAHGQCMTPRPAFRTRIARFSLATIRATGQRDAIGKSSVIWAKTDAGRIEMQARALVKERAQRNLLLLIDGRSPKRCCWPTSPASPPTTSPRSKSMGLIEPVPRRPAARGSRPAAAAAAARGARRARRARLRALHRNADAAHLEGARPARLHADARGREGRHDRGAARRRQAHARADPRPQGRSRAAEQARRALYGG